MMHHLIDPATGAPVRPGWRTVSVAASSCLVANVASTAAIVLGDGAPAWLARRQLPARLVRSEGSTLMVGGWPQDSPNIDFDAADFDAGADADARPGQRRTAA
jgi:thiamine biosynthesis lipoprotein